MFGEEFSRINQLFGVGNIEFNAVLGKVIFEMIVEEIAVSNHIDASLMKGAEHIRAENLMADFEEGFGVLFSGADKQIALVVQRAQDNLVIHVSNKGCQSMKCVSRFHMMTSLLFQLSYHYFQIYASAYTQMRISRYYKYRVMEMLVKDAVVQRFKDICRERDMSVNALADVSGVTPSTVYSMFDSKRRKIQIDTIKILCDGLNITLGEFFSAPVFDELEQEIR